MPTRSFRGRMNFPAAPTFCSATMQQQWKKDVPLYSKIQYAGLYPGINAEYTIDGHRIKSEYSVMPGADPHQIVLNYEDAGSIAINKEGALEIRAEGIELTEQSPVAYQMDAAGRAHCDREPLPGAGPAFGRL